MIRQLTFKFILIFLSLFAFNICLQKQEDLLQKKELLQAQLNSLSQNEAGTSGEHLDSTDWENGKFEWSEKLLSLLTSHFKLNSFRPLQTSTINATLSGKDVILIMPTGMCNMRTCWLAIKDLQPTTPVLKAGHPGVLFFVVGLFSGVCFVVARLFVWVGWLGDFSVLLSLPSSWCAMILCTI